MYGLKVLSFILLLWMFWFLLIRKTIELVVGFFYQKNFSLALSSREEAVPS
ncbi:hypothetical protein HanIR_Chr03g0135851 [Helianthus annuus]|nr:hypothetical protein HanIR_Chr03g0135851 [Helianthus annuus]